MVYWSVPEGDTASRSMEEKGEGAGNTVEWHISTGLAVGGKVVDV